MKTALIPFALLLAGWLPMAAQAPTHLTTDLIEHTDAVMQDGYVSVMPLGRTASAIESYQIAKIRSKHPTLGWVVPGKQKNTLQTAYRIQVASSPELLKKDKPDVWDSGKTLDRNSTTVVYGGPDLQPDRVYYWKVKTWDNYGTGSRYSAIRAFATADTLDNATAAYPLQTASEYPTDVQHTDSATTFVAFEKAAFGKLYLTLSSETGMDTVSISIGEKRKGMHVDRLLDAPSSSIRYTEYHLPLRSGTNTYIIKFRPDNRNTEKTRANSSGVLPVLMPSYIGEVYPFRYCEIKGYKGRLSERNVRRQSVFYPFDDSSSSFESSDSVLNKVWDLCKYSIKATSFSGIFVDGDRERIAYEADAIIGQLGQYCVDREFTLGRRSSEYLLENPTWPTEWNLQSPIIAWYDYLYTGDSRSMARFYDVLKAKTFRALRDVDGLISTRRGLMDKDFYQSINFKGRHVNDIVDWPQGGYVGKEKDNPGEADGFKFTTYNSVVNAYHYNALRILERMAGILGHKSDSLAFADEAAQTYKSFNKKFFNRKTKHYMDGIGTTHESLHANMYALCFGLVPERYRKDVTDFVVSRRMACSVFGAQFLLDALYGNDRGDYALTLLDSTGERSWYNMIRKGSTIAMEAWDDKYKPNQDWNHVWGAAPANLIVRGLFGIRPIEPAYAKFRIKPQPGTLRKAALKVPTIRGTVRVSFDNNPGESLKLRATVPANTVSEVWMPRFSGRTVLSIDGEEVKTRVDGNWFVATIGSGQHELSVYEEVKK